MKKATYATLLLVCLLALMLAQPARAQEMGNPVTLTPKGQFTLDLSAYQVFEQKHQDFRLKSSNSDGTSDTGTFGGSFRDDQYFLLGLTYGLRDWLNLFAQAGQVHGGKFLSVSPSNPQEWEAKMKDQFVWALGAKAQAFKLSNGLALGLSTRYLRYDDRKLGPWHENKSGYDDATNWRDEEKLSYWQFDLSAVLSLPLGPLTPYAGLGYTYAEAKESGGNYSLHGPEYVGFDATIRNRDQVLALCGFDLALGKDFSLYLQAEMLARNTLGLGLSWSF
jgi:opacity protein-like surface antigen